MMDIRALLAVSAALALALAGCGGGPPKQADDASGFPQPSQPSEGGSSEAASGGSGEASGDAGGGLTEDQQKQMEIALRRGGEKAANCAEVVADAPKGKAEVEVTFDGQKGRITDVGVGSPWAGTPAESCIKRAFIGEIIMPFDGDPKAVPYTVELADKKAGAKTPPPKK